ncbi:MAG: 2-succinyl-6-hydroxy-2,4-cyclohexadiene-1-carboxylate synthase [Planctomycetes bacterium]|nr:2-succinyl-6-hydroxy-2,4-cyclohexadiene-1-carboxylate synthase [Planctomycetota bacterium]
MMEDGPGGAGSGRVASPVRRFLLRAAVLSLSVLAAASVWLGACAGMSREEAGRAMAALPKNASIVRHGNSGSTFEYEGGRADLRYVRIPATPGTAQGAAGAKTPLLLVHGTPGSSFDWSSVADEIARNGARGRDVYLIDVIGHALAPAGAHRPMTFQKAADWIVAAIPHLGVGRVHVVGHSYAGEFCWRAALDAPQRFASLTLIDSAGHARPADGWLPEEVKMREMWLAPIGWAVLDREKVRGALQPHFDAPVHDDLVDEFLAVSSVPDAWKSMVDLARDENGTREAEIPRIAVPTLLLWGGRDIAYPVDRVARRFEREIAGSRLVVLPDAGHYPHHVDPARVLREILDHADRADAAAAR